MKTISIAQLRVVTRGAIYPHRFRELALWRRLSHYLWSLMGFEGVSLLSYARSPKGAAALQDKCNALESGRAPWSCAWSSKAPWSCA
jgi:hypothetical protein